MQKIATDDAPKAIGPYCQAIVHNGVVYCSGQIPLDPASMQVVAGEIAGALGRGEDTPADTTRRIEMLVCGAVAPVIDIEAAVQIAEGFPFVLGRLTGKIIDLTEGGATLGKPPRCTETTAS